MTSCPRFEQRKRKKRSVFGSVFPGRVVLFDEPDLSSPNPALDLLLASDGVMNVRKLLEIDEARNAVDACETGDEAALVLVDTPCEVVGDPRVQHPRATGHDVDVVGAHGLATLRFGVSAQASFRRHLVLIPASFFSCLRSSEACHPERRRREGPACSFVRRAREEPRF